MFSEVYKVDVSSVSKIYNIYKRPQDRLLQMGLSGISAITPYKCRPVHDSFHAVKGVSLKVRSGETVGIVGRNGSGKSTLLQLICGVLEPSSGSVNVNGRVAALLELGAGFSPEFTGKENVFLNAAILGLPRKEIERRYADIVDFADIGDFIDRPVKTYSSGMYIRLAFSVAINVDPDILVVDEALAVGDEAFQRKCFARIEEIKKRGATILFVSHSAQSVVQLCDRAILLDAGELLIEGSPKIVVSQYQRLVNSSAEDTTRVRNDIRSSGAQVTKPVSGGNVSSSAEIGGDPGERGSSLSSREQVDESWFDQSLIPKSSIEYESKTAKINNPILRNGAGKQVNHLSSGHRYYCEFEVEFLRPCKEVGFGFGLMNIFLALVVMRIGISIVSFLSMIMM